jgi:hypothetical protein
VIVAVLTLFNNEIMPHVLRISKGPNVGDILDSIDCLSAFASSHGWGRQDVDEHFVDALPRTRVTARAWGKVIHHNGGQVVLDPIP